ncbi:MAG TPA: hypothetical protein VG916_06790 [Gemmatimonadaceae bacterium]|nr:hypothetical protein [Gemmatimonadaceae bacterium]
MNRRGFAVPLAVLVLIVLALLAALGIDAALGALRTGDAAAVEARAAARAESGLAKAFVQPLDSAARRLAAGSALFTVVESDPDTVVVRAQVVQPGVVRVTATAVARRGQFRGIAGRYAFATIVADSAPMAGAILRRLPSRWWVAIP